MELTWLGRWTIRFVIVVLGVFCIMLALNLLGLAEAKNPFTAWPAFWQAVALAGGVSALLLLEVVIEHFGWTISIPHVRIEENGKPPPSAPMN